MARVAGVNIPDNKRVVIALTYVYGIGNTTAKKIIDTLGIDPSTRIKDLTEAELSSVRGEIDKNHTVEGDLQRIVSANVKRLKEIGSYRGDRHKRRLPSRGQRTKTNGRTRRGRKATVGGTSIKAPSKT